MKKLSIVILSYNVRFFLQQTLFSVRAAIRNRPEFQIVVVDNHSDDDSCAMVIKHFPEVLLIQNKENWGFSKGNNIGINAVESDFVLLLNPDTLIAEDTLDICLDFMEKNPDCGALGVKMIDGNGVFLPESKRGLPTPLTAFYKIFGLSTLFPKSTKLGKYHLKYLSSEQNHSVEVLSGAFMFMRKEALNKSGLLDEDFFMYGEDIDLSYRILKAGYKNYYLSETCIIHYKGESTQKQSLKYVKVFYEAMFIFFTKHFAFKLGWFFSALIRAAVGLRAMFSGIKRLFLWVRAPLLDFLASLAVYIAIAQYWEEYNKWVEGGAYPADYYAIHLPVYAAFLVLSMLFSGAYRSMSLSTAFKRGAISGVLGLIIVYALLPEPLRFSRAILMLGAILSVVAFFIIRTTIALLFSKRFAYNSENSQKKILFVGQVKEMDQSLTILNQNGSYMTAAQCVRVDPKVALLNATGSEPWKSYVMLFKPLQVIFSLHSTPCKNVITGIQAMQHWGPTALIHNHNGGFLIGSEGKNKPGIVLAEKEKTQSKPSHLKRLNKRVFDVVFCFVWPYIFFKFDSQTRKKLVHNSLGVLQNKASWFWVSDSHNLSMQKGVFDLCKLYPCVPAHQLRDHYYSDYTFAKDWSHVIRLFYS